MAILKIIKAEIKKPTKEGAKIGEYVDAYGSVNGGSLQGIRIFDAEQVAEFKKVMSAHGAPSKDKPIQVNHEIDFRDGQAIVRASGGKADLDGVTVTEVKSFETRSPEAKGKHIVSMWGSYNGKGIRLKAFGEQAEEILKVSEGVSEDEPLKLDVKGFFKEETYESGGEQKRSRYLHVQEVSMPEMANAARPR